MTKPLDQVKNECWKKDCQSIAEITDNNMKTDIIIYDKGFDAAISHLASVGVSGEYKTAFVLFTGKEALLASDKPTKKLHPDDTEVKFIDHTALLAANAKIAQLEEEINLKDLQIKSLAASDTLKKADLLIAELQQRVKELADIVEKFVTRSNGLSINVRAETMSERLYLHDKQLHEDIVRLYEYQCEVEFFLTKLKGGG